MLMHRIWERNWIAGEFIYKDSLDSTNLEALRKADALPHGAVIVAETQTAGLGRSGRKWESPKGENLYFSILLKPEFASDKTPMLTLVMAVAVARAIAHITGANAEIKWPNDIILNNKKVCGILTQMQVPEDGNAQVVIGTGINVNQQVFDEAVLPYATSIQNEVDDVCSREDLLQAVLLEFEELYDAFASEGNLAFIQEEYENLMVNDMQGVRVLDPKGEYEAVALGINELGELMVQKKDGTTEAIYAGEVSVRGLYGYV